MLAEILGLIAGVVVMFSYALEGKKLRIANLIGSILFVIYGVWIGAFSIILLNSVCTFIHLYYILKEEK